MYALIYFKGEMQIVFHFSKETVNRCKRMVRIDESIYYRPLKFARTSV